jgi:hypothetical protein
LTSELDAAAGGTLGSMDGVGPMDGVGSEDI